jgi:PPOX class probable F420-dependent enzyme
MCSLYWARIVGVVRLAPDVARERFAVARVARLSTVRPDGGPHVVPIVFAVVGSTIYTAVDAKPKRTTALQRLANIAAEPRVSVLVDHYEEDWRRLWWVRADGTARVLDPAREAGEVADAVEALALDYAPYADQEPAGPLIGISVQRWLGWSAG